MKIIILLLFFIFFLGCQSYNSVAHNPSVSGEIVDNFTWWDDTNNEVMEMDVTIPIPNPLECAPYPPYPPEEYYVLDDPRPCTLDDLNHDIVVDDEYEPKLSVILNAKNFHSSVENATMKIRGNYSRTLDQKNYAIKLFSKTNLFMKQRKFNLNKHRTDTTRMKNKLALDLIHLVPNITSEKTQFVHLSVNGEDYGLFTHVEAIGKEYLRNRGWNEEDNLYNAVNFLFRQHPDLQVDKDGKPLDEEAFNKIIEIKNGKNHTKLVALIDSINSDENINLVIEKYFNRKNYLTWLALELIFGNKDTVQHNYYLYNPVYSDTFYFLPWDFDGAWAPTGSLFRSEYGISVWWEIPLHRKFLQVKRNREDLYKLVSEIRKKYLTNEVIQEHIDKYKKTIASFIQAPIDAKNLDFKGWQEQADLLLPKIDRNIKLFQSVIGHPMPFYQYFNTNTQTITWSESVDLEHDPLLYRITIADNPDLNQSIFSVDLQADTLKKNDNGLYEFQLKDLLEQGKYYLEIRAQEIANSEHFQVSYSNLKYIFENEDGVKGHKLYSGILEFEIK